MRIECVDDRVMEVERYELSAPPTYRFDVGRRDFLKVAGTGMAVALVIGGAPGRIPAQESGRSGRNTTGPENQVATWLHIDREGGVTVYTGKVEIGQNIRTSLAQAVADELRLLFESVQMVMGDTDLTPYDAGTFGSRSTPTMAPRLRKAAAAAREILIGIAAERLSGDRSALIFDSGRITDRSTGRSVGLGELTGGEPIVHVIPDDQATHARADWTVAGRSYHKVTGRAIVTGAHRYPADLGVPDMLHGKVLRPPAFGAALVSLGSGEAESMPGVTVVRDGNFVGVAAPDPRAAGQALRSLNPEWRRTAQVSRSELFEHLRSTAEGPLSPEPDSSVGRALSAAHRILKQTYTVDYIAHAPLEPRAALAEWSEGRLTVATCAEVAIDRETRDVRIVRVIEAFECGAVVNPDQLRNQIEGCVVQGLGGALFERVDFDDGRILNPSFSGYRVPRFTDLPPIDIVVLDRRDLPSSGAGETPICGIAPAVGNAIYDAVGVRLRSLPLIPNGLKL